VSGKDRNCSRSVIASKPQLLTYQQQDWAVKQTEIKTPVVWTAACKCSICW